MQFIETSSITIHADEFGGRCFIDVFSCRPFDAERAAAVAVAHFGGTPTLRVLQPMSDLAPVFGVLAAVVGVADTIPYVRDTLRGSTRPHRGTWLIWGVPGDRGVPVPARRRRLVEPRHGRRPGRPHGRSSSLLSIRSARVARAAPTPILIAIAGGGVAGLDPRRRAARGHRSASSPPT